jgi:hypothetical protein
VIEPAAQKHFKNKSTDIISYITSTLNGQDREPDEIPGDDAKKNVYKIASCVAMENVPKVSEDYRDTYFHLDPEQRKLIFFHCSP